jgi:hypothetical protein
MKNKAYLLVLTLIILISCNATKKVVTSSANDNAIQGDTVRIANDELEYEVIIIDAGFSSWLASRAFPRNYNSQSYMESKNNLWVSEWNSRILQPMRYDPNLYELRINYDPNTDYGYEVNYLIYNYLVYFQNTYKQKLWGYVPAR